jgi:hypothetical protein
MESTAHRYRLVPGAMLVVYTAAIAPGRVTPGNLDGIEAGPTPENDFASLT